MGALESSAHSSACRACIFASRARTAGDSRAEDSSDAADVDARRNCQPHTLPAGCLKASGTPPVCLGPSGTVLQSIRGPSSGCPCCEAGSAACCPPPASGKASSWGAADDADVVQWSATADAGRQPRRHVRGCPAATLCSKVPGRLTQLQAQCTSSV